MHDRRLCCPLYFFIAPLHLFASRIATVHNWRPHVRTTHLGRRMGAAQCASVLGDREYYFEISQRCFPATLPREKTGIKRNEINSLDLHILKPITRIGPPTAINRTCAFSKTRTRVAAQQSVL